MKPLFTEEDRTCRNVQQMLSDYVDNTLSAHDVWKVEKHLAECGACTAHARQLQATVRLLRTTERHDTGGDFMARLHARLDGLEPERPRRNPLWDSLQDWLAGMRAPLQLRRVPALSLGLAMAALLFVVVVNRPQGDNKVAATVLPIASDSLQRHVALSASNPFDDPVAANLEAHSALADSNNASAQEQDME